MKEFITIFFILIFSIKANAQLSKEDIEMICFCKKNGIKLAVSLYTAIENSNEKQRLYQVLFYNAENLRDFSKAFAFPHPQQQQEYATTVKKHFRKKLDRSLHHISVGREARIKGYNAFNIANKRN